MHLPSPYLKLTTSRDCSTFTVVTLAAPSRWPANPHPWAIWLVSSVSHSPQRPQKASSALLSHPALSFPLTFLLWSENRRPHKAPLSFSSNPRPTCVHTLLRMCPPAAPLRLSLPPEDPTPETTPRWPTLFPTFSGAPAH